MDETPIHLVEYDPAWSERFEREADRVASALGDRMLWIDHVGSTAVPGLASKPIVDLCPVVEDRETALDCVEPLEAIGYRFGFDFEADRIHLGRTAANGHQLDLHLRWAETLDGLEVIFSYATTFGIIEVQESATRRSSAPLARNIRSTSSAPRRRRHRSSKKF